MAAGKTDPQLCPRDSFIISGDDFASHKKSDPITDHRLTFSAKDGRLYIDGALVPLLPPAKADDAQREVYDGAKERKCSENTAQTIAALQYLYGDERHGLICGNGVFTMLADTLAEYLLEGRPMAPHYVITSNDYESTIAISGHPRAIELPTTGSDLGDIGSFGGVLIDELHKRNVKRAKPAGGRAAKNKE